MKALRFLIILFVLCSADCIFCDAQSGTWVWMNGSDTLYHPGSHTFYSEGDFGTQGVASVHNTPPGFVGAVQWTDKQGNFWIFGGYNVNTNGVEQGWSDLWRYDPTVSTWTWIKGPGIPSMPGIYGTLGVPSIGNIPGSRGSCASWTDSVDDLWLFSGDGLDSVGNPGELNDLWKYHIASNEWTWMGGSSMREATGVYGNLYQPSDSSLPPPRQDAISVWVDPNNDLWFFGGFNTGGLNNGNYSDLWRYNITSGQWAWMGGSQQLDVPPNYGTFGVESASNFPGGRCSYAHWIDSEYFYLYGGIDFPDGNFLFFNDVWRFNLTTNYWTWVGGDSSTIDSGHYSHYCSTDFGDEPRGRYEERSAQTNSCSPILYMFGGSGGNGYTITFLDDLWSFDLANKRWRWVSGLDSSDPTGNFGIKGLGSPLNMPPGLFGTCVWSDAAGNLWIFGGLTGNSNSGFYINSMWKYIPDLTCLPEDTGNLNYQIAPASICPGDSAFISFSGGSDISIIPDNLVTWIDSVQAILKPDTTTVFTINGYTSCGVLVSQVFTLPVVISPVSITSNKTSMCPGDSAQICAITGFNTYYWNTGDTTACINATLEENYTVTVSDNGLCSATSNTFHLTVYNPSPVTISVSGDTLTGYIYNSYQWLLNGVPITGATSQVYIANASGTYTLQVTDSDGCVATSSPVVIAGISNELAENSISIFPNPTNTSWQLAVANELMGSVIKVFDATGRLVFQSEIRNPKSEINIPTAASGVYELRITSGSYNVVRKLVKM